MKLLRNRILQRKESNGGFTVIIPSIPGCKTYGDIIENAIDISKGNNRIINGELKKYGEKVPTKK
jgi:predicted RNase H-like HicB family nuclease